MKTLKIISKLCGIVGGVWIIVLLLFVLTKRPSASFPPPLPVLFVGFIPVVLGVLALVSILALKNKLWLRRVLMLVSIAGVIVWGIFTMLISLLLPAVILLIVAVIGTWSAKETPLQEVT